MRRLRRGALGRNTSRRVRIRPAAVCRVPAPALAPPCSPHRHPLRASEAREIGWDIPARLVSAPRFRSARAGASGTLAPGKKAKKRLAGERTRGRNGAGANTPPRCGRRRRDGGDWRREASRPSQAHRSGGCMAHRGPRRMSGGGVTTEADARTQTCQRGEERARQLSGLAQGRGSLGGRTRTQSNDCGGCVTRRETHLCARESEVGAFFATR